MKLILNALTKYIAGIVLVGLLLFQPAGTFEYQGAWLFMALLFLPMLVLGIVLCIKTPELLAKRLNNKEKEATQKGVIGVSGLAFLAVFVLTGLDHRFGWSEVPMWLTMIASAILLISYGLYAEVMRSFHRHRIFL